MFYCLLLTLFAKIFLFQATDSVILKEINVPAVVIIDGDSTEDITLDCQYDLEDGSSFLVIKWAKDNEAVFQWIKGQTPSIFPNFKDEIAYQKSSDTSTALTLVNPNINSSGIYKCSVLSQGRIQSIQKRLQVIDISHYNIKLLYHELQNGTYLECNVENVYPKPSLYLTTNTDEDITALSSQVMENEDGFFNATTAALVNNSDVAEYKCVATFSDLSFNLTASVPSDCGRIMAGKIICAVTLLALLL